MTMDLQRPDDATLSAWLDGELSAADRAAVDAWLRNHPEDAANLRIWAADRDALQARYNPVLEEPLPARLADLVRFGQRAAPAWKQAAMATGLLLAGGLIGAALVSQGPAVSPPQAARSATGGLLSAALSADWPRRAAVAHAVYVPEVRHPVDVNVTEGDAQAQKAQEDHLSRWLTKRLTMPVRLFDLRAHGFALVGGRLLPDASGPSAQLMYQGPDSQRVTVYLRKPDDATPAAFRFDAEGNLGLFYWVEGGSGYALVGALPRERLLALSESIYAQIQAATAAASAPR